MSFTNLFRRRASRDHVARLEAKIKETQERLRRSEERAARLENKVEDLAKTRIGALEESLESFRFKLRRIDRQLSVHELHQLQVAVGNLWEELERLQGSLEDRGQQGQPVGPATPLRSQAAAMN